MGNTNLLPCGHILAQRRSGVRHKCPRPGNSGSNTAADHITVLDLALAQIPDQYRHGEDVLIRCDSAGASHAFLRHIRRLREQGVRTFFSVGVAITEPVRAAITECVDWIPAIDADRELRDGAEIAEITHLVDLSAYPEGTRMIVRRERPHPGAQLSLFDTIEGLRHQAFITDSPRPAGSVQLLELRHRAHARVVMRSVKLSGQVGVSSMETGPWASVPRRCCSGGAASLTGLVPPGFVGGGTSPDAGFSGGWIAA